MPINARQDCIIGRFYTFKTYLYEALGRGHSRCPEMRKISALWCCVLGPQHIEGGTRARAGQENPQLRLAIEYIIVCTVAKILLFTQRSAGLNQDFRMASREPFDSAEGWAICTRSQAQHESCAKTSRTSSARLLSGWNLDVRTASGIHALVPG